MGSDEIIGISLRDPRASKVISERLLHHLWLRKIALKRGLRTCDGQDVEVSNPGLWNGQEGPDFLNARLQWADGRCLEGHVEVHLFSSDWKRHGHHADERYDGVILHVAMWNLGGERFVINSKGSKVPQMCLSDGPWDIEAEAEEEGLLDGVLRARPVARPGRCLEAAEARGLRCLGEVLDRAGQERMIQKVQRCVTALDREERDAVLYEALMKALDPKGQGGPLGMMAKDLPYGLLRDLFQGATIPQRAMKIQALFFGMLDLLPFTRERGRGESLRSLEEMREEWERQKKALGLKKVARVGPWAWGRPANHPLRRLAGVSFLLARTMNEGLAPFILRLFAEGGMGRQRFEALRDALVVVATGFWAERYTWYDKKKVKALSLIGREKASLLALNVLLPFGLAVAMREGKEGLVEEGMETYSIIPALTANHKERFMMERLVGPWRDSLPMTAQRQQGLLHLFHAFCQRDFHCLSCPIPSEILSHEPRRGEG